MPLTFTAIPTKDARDAQSGKPDANGQLPEHAISDGNGNPCRHCLKDIPKDAPMLILAYRPFPSAQPYAEVGPIFLCATLCKRHSDSQALPDMLKNNTDLMRKTVLFTAQGKSQKSIKSRTGSTPVLIIPRSVTITCALPAITAFKQR